jgi:TPP-dependent pyruvate/acetoin dehydrogenase alpha subunit
VHDLGADAVTTEIAASAVDLSAEQALRMHRTMLLIRHFEEQVDDLYRRALMPGLAHLYAGEEAVAVGVCEALRPGDLITSTHRGHGHCLAKGASVERMFAELLGRRPGYCKGKGGSMHIADSASGNLGANAIVGGSSAIAAGAALSASLQGLDRVTVCFFGEGALGQGILYESMNMAALWQLPVLYACENNRYSEYTPFAENTAGSILARPEAFGIPAVQVDGQDVRAVWAAAVAAVERARAGDGPTFLLLDTYRFHGHFVGDVDRAYYRPKDEEDVWRLERDPIRLHAAWLLATGAATEAVLDKMAADLREEITRCVDLALSAPFPDAAEVDDDVFA